MSAVRFKIKERDSEDVVTSSENCFELKGRQIIEFDVLAKELSSGCKRCGAPRHLLNCFQETESWLGSFLYINCNNSNCGEINICHSNKLHRSSDKHRGRPIFDVNTKLAVGMFRSKYA